MRAALAHVWQRHGAFGYECLRCRRSTGAGFDDLPRGECK